MIDALRPVQSTVPATERRVPTEPPAATPTSENQSFSSDTLQTPAKEPAPAPLNLSLPPRSEFATVIRPQEQQALKLAPVLGVGVTHFSREGISALGVAGSIVATGAGLYAGDWAARELYPGQEDKRKHALVGGVISGVGGAAVTAVTKNRLLGALAGIALGTVAGAAKEIYDKTSGKGTPDVHDFYATALGAVTVGVTLTIPFR